MDVTVVFCWKGLEGDSSLASGACTLASNESFALYLNGNQATSHRALGCFGNKKKPLVCCLVLEFPYHPWNCTNEDWGKQKW